MTRLGVLLAAVVLAAVCLTSALAVPPVPKVRYAFTPKQPRAETLFTGVTVTSLGAHITKVGCDAKIGSKILHAKQQRFFSSLVPGPATVSCSWQIPAGSGGRVLRAAVYALTTTSVLGGTGHAWHIRP
jgi:hypothetical protein